MRARYQYQDGTNWTRPVLSAGPEIVRVPVNVRNGFQVTVFRRMGEEGDLEVYSEIDKESFSWVAKA